MKKENDISNPQFIDFELFVVPDQNSNASRANSVPPKKILIIYENLETDPQLETLLKNILSAAEIDIDSQVVLIKKTPEEQYSFINLQKKWQLQDAILFGVQASDFGINYQLTDYQSVEHNGFRFLRVDALAQIHSDVQKKKALWTCLQEMYLN